jgi:hypothetical protein
MRNLEELAARHLISSRRRAFVATAALSFGLPAILTSRRATAAEPVTVEIQDG